MTQTPAADIVERLRAVDHMSVEECFLLSYLYDQAATEIEALRAREAELQRELAESKAQFDEHVKWASDQSAKLQRKLDEAAKQFKDHSVYLAPAIYSPKSGAPTNHHVTEEGLIGKRVTLDEAQCFIVTQTHVIDLASIRGEG